LSQERWARLASWVVGVAAFAGYAWTCAPSAYLLDSAELAQAAFGLGVAHPPGEPVAALWGRLFCFLPAGSVAFRVGLGQAVAGAVAAVLVVRLSLRLYPRLDPDGALGPATRALLAVAAGLAYACTPGAIIVSDRPEVYALQTALSLGALLAALRALDDRDPRWLLLAALLLGLGVANHPLVAGLAGVGAALAALPFLRAGRARLVALSVLALAAGMVALVYLPVRAGALFAQAAARGADTLAWGDARTPAGLWWLLSARTFASKAAVVHTAATPLDLPFVLMEELEVVFAVLAPIGLVFLVRRPGARLAALALTAAWAGSMAAALIGGFDPANPDVRGYLGPAIALTALFSTTAVAAGLMPMRRWALPWLTPLLAGWLALAPLTRFPHGDVYPGLRHAATADALMGELLHELPARATLLTAHVESAFVASYQRVVEGRRPDVAWAHLGFLGHPGAHERLSAAEPALGPLLAGPLSPASLGALDDRRPVRLEVDEHLPPEVRRRLVPDGLTWRLDDGTHRYARTGSSSFVGPEAAADRQVRGYLSWRAYNDAALACANGLTEAARQRLSTLRDLVPQDRAAQALVGHCPALSNKPPVLRTTP
jgi:hypothetical protein